MPDGVRTDIVALGESGINLIDAGLEVSIVRFETDIRSTLPVVRRVIKAAVWSVRKYTPLMK